MALTITKEQIWAGDIQDQPGGLAAMLEKLTEAGADIECVIARRAPDRSGSGVVFVTPIKGRKVQVAASAAGLTAAPDIATLRVEGPDKPGLGGRMAHAIADAGVNIRGLSAMVLGNKFVAWIGFDSADAAGKAAKALKAMK